MPESWNQRIVDALIAILGQEPQGMKTAELVKRVKERLPGIKIKEPTIHQRILDYVANRDSVVYKPAKGLFIHKQFRDDTSAVAESQAGSSPEKVMEKDFYASFAHYLIELDECTKAVPLGGNAFGDKWGTPDVIGVYRAWNDLFHFPIEVVSAEIKRSTQAQDLITAFGQACAYRLFSHKSYLVIPKAAQKGDLERIESLCLIFGMGLILFDAVSPQDPKWEIRARAAKHDPDVYYVNEKLQVEDVAKRLLH